MFMQQSATRFKTVLSTVMFLISPTLSYRCGSRFFGNQSGQCSRNALDVIFVRARFESWLSYRLFNRKFSSLFILYSRLLQLNPYLANYAHMALHISFDGVKL